MDVVYLALAALLVALIAGLIVACDAVGSRA